MYSASRKDTGATLAGMGTAAERRRLAHAMPPLADADDAAIERFIDAIWAERGLSAATLEAYRRDLQGLARWRGALAGLYKHSGYLTICSDNACLQ